MTAILKEKAYPVAMRSGVTPVPIPNTTVKTGTAESTILETIWEGRWLPDSFLEERDGLHLENYIRHISYSNPNILFSGGSGDADFKQRIEEKGRIKSKTSMIGSLLKSIRNDAKKQVKDRVFLILR